MRNERMTARKAALEDRNRLLTELAAGLDAIESEMPHQEPELWFEGEPTAAADTFARIESETEVFRHFAEALEDGVALELCTLTSVAARRSTEALSYILRYIEGMGFVAGSGVLGDVVVPHDVERLDDIDRVNGFLESVLTEVRDEVQDSCAAVQDLKTLKGNSARDLCDEFAKEAADTIVAAVGGLRDPIEAPIEAREYLGNADRNVFTDDVLRRSVALVILGHMHMCVSDTYERFKVAASLARIQLELCDRGPRPMHPRDVNPRSVFEDVHSAFTELLEAGRDAAAYRSAFAALENRLGAILDQ